MSSSLRPRFSSSLLPSAAALALAGVTACAGATRSAPPHGPEAKGEAVGRTSLTAAEVTAKTERLLVADKGVVAMVARGGCVAALVSGVDTTGGYDEMRVRCPRPERLAEWFASVDRLAEKIPVERAAEDTLDDKTLLPTAELAFASGDVFRVSSRSDAERLASAVRALSAELVAGELPGPGPASAHGFQMLRVSGPAHVVFAGSPTTGVLDARVSTTGQYLCEFVANTADGPLRATKGGWIGADRARRAIDEVLGPFETSGPDRRSATFAVAMVDGRERRANAASTAQVFERFAAVQDALGDACLPELEPPAAVGL